MRFFNSLRKIKAVILLLCVIATGVSATEDNSLAKITISVKGTTLINVLMEIESQTDYLFVYNSEEVNLKRETSIDVKDVQIDGILQKLFSNTEILYVIEGKNVMLLKRPDLQQAKHLITGSVIDEQGEPLIGATILEKGSASNGTVTDADGKFTLSVSENAVLQVSFIGYITQEISVPSGSGGGAKPLIITLLEDTQALEEVVVIGYGTMKKKDLTGSVASVQGENLLKRSTQQLSTALQGQMAGVQVTRDNGAPGASATVRIRGITTLSNNDPLVIVDGVPSALNDVATADVETMTVLKDAASASIYGSRAAAGVILITTKRAKDRQFSFDYNYEYGIDRPTTKPKNGDVIDWMNVQNEIKWNDGAADPYSQYSQETINSWLSKNATDPWHYPNTNWVDLMLKETSAHEQHTLSVSGGTEKLRTKSTINYQKGDGYYEHKSYERFTGRINNDYKITDWLNANFDLDFSKSSAISPSNLNAIYWAYL
ncbi:MAG: SusC/RagA family TonB-linked outer membrane protein, partial [Tannerella sp.]|nr:SusC/RagA family TonB-linked outer membrane protein [Tannerella sp.]